MNPTRWAAFTVDEVRELWKVLTYDDYVRYGPADGEHVLNQLIRELQLNMQLRGFPAPPGGWAFGAGSMFAEWPPHPGPMGSE